MGPSILLEALDPSVQRWYLPQELFAEYGRRQWQYTNYAREPYRRYLERQLEGFIFTTISARLSPEAGSSTIGGRPVRVPSRAVNSPSPDATKLGFSALVIGKDRSGDYGYSILIGDEINATLTPMTFRKAGFNGIATSLVGDRFRATGLFSRISAPIVEIDYLAPTVGPV